MKFYLILKSFNTNLLEKTVNELQIFLNESFSIISLPKKRKKFCVLKSPHTDKDSREQFEIRSSKRLLIISPTNQTVDALMKLNLSAGVNIKIALNQK